MITFYDLAAKDGIKTWSPNPWKTRYALNYKKLPYKTVQVEFPDIEATFKELGIPPSETKADGTGLYTSPSIIDDTTGTAVSESYKIAEYLDKAYPSTPPLIPAGTEAFQAAFYNQFGQLISPIWPLLLPRVPHTVLNPRSAEYFIRTRGEWLGTPLADLEPHGEARVEGWKKVREVFDTIDGWLGKSGGPYFGGNTVTFSDLVVAGLLHSIKYCFGEGSDEWKSVATWKGGKWKVYLESLDKYASVEA